MERKEEVRAATGGKINILPGQFVLAVKHKGTGEVVLRARFVIGGQRDKQKQDIVHNASANKAQSVRLLLALEASLGFDV